MNSFHIGYTLDGWALLCIYSNPNLILIGSLAICGAGIWRHNEYLSLTRHPGSSISHNQMGEEWRLLVPQILLSLCTTQLSTSVDPRPDTLHFYPSTSPQACLTVTTNICSPLSIDQHTQSHFWDTRASITPPCTPTLLKYNTQALMQTVVKVWEDPLTLVILKIYDFFQLSLNAPEKLKLSCKHDSTISNILYYIVVHIMSLLCFSATVVSLKELFILRDIIVKAGLLHIRGVAIHQIQDLIHNSFFTIFTLYFHLAK